MENIPEDVYGVIIALLPLQTAAMYGQKIPVYLSRPRDSSSSNCRLAAASKGRISQLVWSSIKQLELPCPHTIGARQISSVYGRLWPTAQFTMKSTVAREDFVQFVKLRLMAPEERQFFRGVVTLRLSFSAPVDITSMVPLLSSLLSRIQNLSIVTHNGSQVGVISALNPNVLRTLELHGGDFSPIGKEINQKASWPALVRLELVIRITFFLNAPKLRFLRVCSDGLDKVLDFTVLKRYVANSKLLQRIELGSSFEVALHTGAHGLEQWSSADALTAHYSKLGRELSILSFSGRSLWEVVVERFGEALDADLSLANACHDIHSLTEAIIRLCTLLGWQDGRGGVSPTHIARLSFLLQCAVSGIDEKAPLDSGILRALAYCARGPTLEMNRQKGFAQKISFDDALKRCPLSVAEISEKIFGQAEGIRSLQALSSWIHKELVSSDSRFSQRAVRFWAACMLLPEYKQWIATNRDLFYVILRSKHLAPALSDFPELNSLLVNLGHDEVVVDWADMLPLIELALDVGAIAETGYLFNWRRIFATQDSKSLDAKCKYVMLFKGAFPDGATLYCAHTCICATSSFQMLFTLYATWAEAYPDLANWSGLVNSMWLTLEKYTIPEHRFRAPGFVAVAFAETADFPELIPDPSTSPNILSAGYSEVIEALSATLYKTLRPEAFSVEDRWQELVENVAAFFGVPLSAPTLADAADPNFDQNASSLN